MDIQHDLSVALTPLVKSYHPAVVATALIEIAAALIADNCSTDLMGKSAEAFQTRLVNAIAYYRANPVSKIA